MENAATGTVVGTAAGVDPDASDTKTYSLTDTAGGRFAINSTTGVITVADGSGLNYEGATSHSITVRVTDAGGQHYDKTFTIGVTNVNTAPPGIDGGDGGEQGLVAALFQGSAAGPDTDQPLTHTVGIDADSETKPGMDELRNPVEWNTQPTTVDILDTGRNHLHILPGGDAKPVEDVGRKQSSSTSSDQHEVIAGSSDSMEGLRHQDDQMPWPPIEGMQPVPDDAGDLAMPMVAGLVGAALQGNMRKKEKLTTMHGDSPIGVQKTANEQTAQESSPDDNEAPPRAA